MPRRTRVSHAREEFKQCREKDLFIASFGQFRAKDIADAWNIANAFVTERFSHEFTEFLGRRRTHRC